MELNQRLEALEHKVRQLERELAELKNDRRALSTPASALSAQPETGSINRESTSAQGAEALHTEPQAAVPRETHAGPTVPNVRGLHHPSGYVPPARQEIDWEHLIAKVWLPRIFIIVFLLGVLWGFTAAVNAGLITEPVRCALGLLASALMYGLGELQFKRQRAILGQTLLGGSVTVLILTLFAAHMLYGFTPAWLAFILYVASIGAGVYAALRRRSEAILVLVSVAGYMIPFLIDSATPNEWVFTMYESIFSVAIMALSVRFAYTVAFGFAFGILHLPLLLGYLFVASEMDADAFAAAVLLQHAALFVISVMRRAQQADKRVQIPLYLGFVLTTCWLLGLYESGNPALYRIIVALLAVLYSLTAYISLRQRHSAAVYLSIATYGWFLLLIELFQAEHQAMTVIAEGVIAVVLGMKLGGKLQFITGSAAFLFGSVSVLIVPIEEVLSLQTLSWIVWMASVLLLYRFSRQMPESWYFGRYRHYLLWADAVLLLIFISQITGSLTEHWPDDMGRLVLSAVWVAYAIAVILTGMWRDRRRVRLAGVLFLFLTLIKIILFDLSDMSTFVRAILFLGLGSIGLGASRLFYRRPKQ